MKISCLIQKVADQEFTFQNPDVYMASSLVISECKLLLLLMPNLSLDKQGGKNINKLQRIFATAAMTFRGNNVYMRKHSGSLFAMFDARIPKCRADDTISIYGPEPNISRR